MIGMMFMRGGDEAIEIRLSGNSLTWRSTAYGVAWFPIEAISLPKDKVVREFPDLKENAEWREQAIKRLKEHIAGMITEKQKMEYIVDEMRKVGYQCHSYQQQGGRIHRWRS